jgi:hypothetical protein
MIHVSKMPRQNPLGPINIYTLKNEGQKGKTGFFQGCTHRRESE